MLRSLLLLPLLLAGPASAAPPPAATPQTPVAAPVTPVPPAPPAASAEAVRRVPIAEAKEAVQSGKAVVVDVRSAADYAAAHVHGALSIPLGEIEQRSKELPRDRFIITYCT